MPAPDILDVGAGLGMAWPALAAGGGTVTAIEADASLVAISRPRAASLGVEVHHADVQSWLDPDDARYGLIWAGDVLWRNYFPDPQAIVHRLMQAVAPGGRLAVFTGNWYASRFLWGYPDLERAVLRANARRWDVPPDGDASHHERAARWLIEAGGGDLRVSLHPRPPRARRLH
jgi:2-polyprenyl-3-methyl-5-hydroxy-6-metoxy-1,4-benzoquinol methylase